MSGTRTSKAANDEPASCRPTRRMPSCDFCLRLRQQRGMKHRHEIDASIVAVNDWCPMFAVAINAREYA